VSGPESGSASGPPPGITCASLPADIIELAALRERTQVLKALAARRGLALPSVGWIITARETLVVCVRPERWLLLSAPNLPGAALAGWRTAGAGCAAATYVAQVPVMLAALPAGWLLLTPSTTMRHFSDWLGASARAFGFVPNPSVTVGSLSGEKTP